MSRFAYVDGQFVPSYKAVVSINDRGYQFSDGIYEALGLLDGKPVDYALHMARLRRSLREIRFEAPMSEAAMTLVFKRLVALNRVKEGLLYFQVTRGVAPRNHPFPNPAVRPVLVATVRPKLLPSASLVEKGAEVITVPDQRWGRCDIKSLSLLANVFAKQAAVEAGAYEAWQVRADGTITEGASSNAWIVSEEGEILTHPLDAHLLPGVTRAVILDLARREGLTVTERPFALEEITRAREAFATSTSAFALSVVRVNGTLIGDGVPGPVAQRLRSLYIERLKTLPAATSWTL